jgi:hypothetical protein
MKLSRLLGLAFLLQFVTSFSSGIFVLPLWYSKGQTAENLVKIAQQPWLVRANLLLDILTALGILFLGAALYSNVRREHETLALTGLSFYILEAGLLAASRVEAFKLLTIGQEYAASGQPALWLSMGRLVMESMDFGGNVLHMLTFCLGAGLFYSLMYRARTAPRWLTGWGLVCLPFCLAGTLIGLFGQQPPFWLYAAYVPFELVIGLWLLVRG